MSYDLWRIDFPNGLVKTLLQVAFYDHRGMQGFVVDSPFQFESIWQTYDYFKMDLIRWWNLGHDLIEKLSKVEVELKMWRTIYFGSVIKKKELLACLGDNKKKRQPHDMSLVIFLDLNILCIRN